MFDRAIEAIQEAAQDSGFVYDSSWFPWNQTEKSYELLSEQVEAEELRPKQAMGRQKRQRGREVDASSRQIPLPL